MEIKVREGRREKKKEKNIVAACFSEYTEDVLMIESSTRAPYFNDHRSFVFGKYANQFDTQRVLGFGV